VEPDLLIKGGDYLPDDIVGVRDAVLVIPFVDGSSSSALIQRIQSS